jgi:hypothetical protein
MAINQSQYPEKIGPLIALSRNEQFLTRTIAQRTKCDRYQSALDCR